MSSCKSILQATSCQTTAEFESINCIIRWTHSSVQENHTSIAKSRIACCGYINQCCRWIKCRINQLEQSIDAQCIDHCRIDRCGYINPYRWIKWRSNRIDWLMHLYQSLPMNQMKSQSIIHRSLQNRSLCQSLPMNQMRNQLNWSIETKVTDSTVDSLVPIEYLRGIINESATCYLIVASHHFFAISECRVLIGSRSDSISQSINSIYLKLCHSSKNTPVDALTWATWLGSNSCRCSWTRYWSLLEHIDRSIFQSQEHQPCYL